MCAFCAGFTIANFSNLKKHKQPSKCVLDGMKFLEYCKNVCHILRRSKLKSPNGKVLCWSFFAYLEIFAKILPWFISINLLLLVSSNIWILWFNSPMSFRFSFILSFILLMPPPSLSSICVWALYQKQPPVVVCKKWCSSKFRKIHRKIPVPESRF